MPKKTVVVNLLAGPGAGKTTCAWAIASELKKRGIEAEYVSEYAKELVWENRLDLLDGSAPHQQAIYAEQNHRVQRLLGKVDVVVTDSPALLSLLYIKEPSDDFTKDVLTQFHQQQNFNLFINRGKSYQQTGRLQTLEESISIDNNIKRFLNGNNIYYGTYYHHTLDVVVDNIITNFNHVNKETVIVDSDKNLFFIAPEKQCVIWMYFNPDSFSEGQFVRNTVAFGDIQKAASLYSDPGMFFDYIGTVCKQELIDNGTEEFEVALKEFCQAPRFTDCTKETMDNLVKESAGAILYDTAISPMDELHNKIKNLATTYKDSPENIAELLAFKARFYQYSVRNTMLIQADNPRATFVGSFQKFKELGYSVKKGEHGIKILVPVQVTLFRESQDSEWISVSKATKAQKAALQKGEFETRKILAFKIGTVFDISQTTCPIEDYPKLFNFGIPDELHKDVCQKLAEFSEKELGCPVKEADYKSIALLGQFNRVDNIITLNEKMEDTQRLSTLSHELGHAIMHRHIGEKPIVQVELEADAFSIMLNARLGIELTDTRKSHLAGHYAALQEYNDTLPKAADVITLDTILENASSVYEQYIETIEKYVLTTSMVKTTDNVVPFETLKNSVPDLSEIRGAVMEEALYDKIRPLISSVTHSVLVKDGTVNIAFRCTDKDTVANAIVESTLPQPTSKQTYTHKR